MSDKPRSFYRSLSHLLCYIWLQMKRLHDNAVLIYILVEHTELVFTYFMILRLRRDITQVGTWCVGLLLRGFVSSGFLWGGWMEGGLYHWEIRCFQVLIPLNPLFPAV